MGADRATDRLIVALDAEPGRAMELGRALQGHVRWVKVGMTLFYEAGPAIVSQFTQMGFSVFLDLKLHDIPHQVEGAARVIAGLGAQMITVHASGGAEMMRAAVRGASRGADEAGATKPSVLAVTVLTSLGEEELGAIGMTQPPSVQVQRLASLAMDAGCEGVVCSPLEAGLVRGLLGDQALVVTPGVRPVGSDTGDQARIMTPSQALRAGASHLVVGRPITGAADPVFAADGILEQMEA